MMCKAAGHLDEPEIVEKGMTAWRIYAGQNYSFYSYLRDQFIPKPHHHANVHTGLPISPFTHQARGQNKAFQLSPYQLSSCKRLPILQVQTSQRQKQHMSLFFLINTLNIIPGFICPMNRTPELGMLSGKVFLSVSVLSGLHLEKVVVTFMKVCFGFPAYWCPLSLSMTALRTAYWYYEQ